MSSETSSFSQAQITLLAARIGALPDAPLAMPKQRLEPRGAVGRGTLAALIRPFIARAGRSRG